MARPASAPAWRTWPTSAGACTRHPTPPWWRWRSTWPATWAARWPLRSRRGSCCALADPPVVTRRREATTREAIDPAAVALFARLGYHATSMREIAKAAGVQPAAIYHWYPSKEAILIRLQDDFMAELTERVEAGIARHERPALQLAAAVWEHVVFHGLHTQAAFVTDSEIRALAPEPRALLI